jgi:hypothetical protein
MAEHMEKLTKQMVLDDVMAIIKPPPAKATRAGANNRGVAFVEALLAKAQAGRGQQLTPSATRQPARQVTRPPATRTPSPAVPPTPTPTPRTL